MTDAERFPSGKLEVKATSHNRYGQIHYPITHVEPFNGKASIKNKYRCSFIPCKRFVRDWPYLQENADADEDHVYDL